MDTLPVGGSAAAAGLLFGAAALLGKAGALPVHLDGFARVYARAEDT
jgi:hypothetical protein